jgi:branched-subunit amino acid transport protein AzlD
MRIPDTQAILMIFIMAGITLLIRVLPFILFPGNKKTPSYILYLGKVLPYAIISMLVVYCLKDVTVTAFPFGLPELLACLFIVGVHVWKRNTLLSIGGGTLFYMFLVQFVFV